MCVVKDSVYVHIGEMHYNAYDLSYQPYDFGRKLHRSRSDIPQKNDPKAWMEFLYDYWVQDVDLDYPMSAGRVTVMRTTDGTQSFSELNTQFLVDHNAQRIYVISDRFEDGKAVQNFKTLSLDGKLLDSKETEITTRLSAVMDGGIVWKNATDSWLYGHIGNKYAVAYNISNDTIITKYAPNGIAEDDVMDVLQGAVYYRDKDNVVHERKPAEDTISIVGMAEDVF